MLESKTTDIYLCCFFLQVSFKGLYVFHNSWIGATLEGLYPPKEMSVPKMFWFELSNKARHVHTGEPTGVLAEADEKAK